ncbi:hypothetical protein G4E76_003850 [Salmonella enterica]|nr:hypothetical protein [Salmonella enterica]
MKRLSVRQVSLCYYGMEYDALAELFRQYLEDHRLTNDDLFSYSYLNYPINMIRYSEAEGEYLVVASVMRYLLVDLYKRLYLPKRLRIKETLRRLRSERST